MSLTAYGQQYDTSVFDKLWADPEIETRIQDGIEENRKGTATIKILDAGKKSIPGAKIEVEQISHEFLFGANTFMLDGFETPERNRKFEEAFKQVFNFASVAFFWKDIEPEEGKYRYGKDSPKIYRRPAPDIVVDFCKKNEIKMKGHTLIWNSRGASLPEWYPKEEYAFKKSFRKRIEGISDRYGDAIQYWDVANETTHVPVSESWLPKDYVYYTFKLCEKYFPMENTLIYNEVPETFVKSKYGEYSHLYLLIQSLLERGAKIDMIGLQFHIFDHIVPSKDVFLGKGFTPQQVFDVLDLYGELGFPLNISEITFPALPEGPQGLENQAKLTRNFYRLFFSHPQMEAITWWNMPDGYAYGKEDRYHAGCLDKSLEPKPAYHVLDELINREWHTKTEIHSDQEAKAKFRGFFGKYKLTITHNGKKVEHIINLAKHGTRTFNIVID